MELINNIRNMMIYIYLALNVNKGLRIHLQSVKKTLNKKTLFLSALCFL